MPQNSISELDKCAEEPVHTIARIQPHGVLFGISEPGLIVRQVSSNVFPLLSREPESVLGCSFETILDSEQFELFRSRVLDDATHTANPFRVRVGIDALQMDCLAHRRDGMLIVELEFLDAAHSIGPLNLDSHIRLPLSRMEAAAGIPQLSQVAATEIKRLSGFHRVMVYGFDEEWNGEVIAEAMSQSPVSYLGLHFPASDIPPQARQLFLLNRSRTVVDVAATPVSIVPEFAPLTGTALDLSCSFLRASAPVHLEYLRNLGVRSSLTISIIVGARLWGLITCHHAAPHHLDYATRSACELIGEMFGSQAALRIDNSAFQMRLTSRNLLHSYMAGIDASGSLVYADFFHPQQLLELFGADGLVLRIDGVVSCCGDALPENKLLLLLQKMQGILSRGIGSCNALSALDQGAASFGTVSGALYIGLTEDSGDFLLLLRRELVESVIWAGNPDKRLSLDEQGRLRPRTSFEAWREFVSGGGRPWSDLELESARFLREQLLRLKETLAALNAQQLEHRTARKQAEEALRDQAIILDHANDSIFIRDAEDRITYWNQGAQRLYGWSKDEAVGRVPEALLKTRFSQSLEDIRSQLLTQGYWKGELGHTRRDGSLVTVASSWTLQRGDSVRPASVLEISQDITARKEAEQQLEINRRKVIDGSIQLQAVNKELEEFVYAASHDLKAPLRVIDNASRWLEEDLQEHLTDETRENMNLLRGRVARMDKLLDDLLEYARIGRAADGRYAEVIAGDALLNDVLALLSQDDFTLVISPRFRDIQLHRMPLQQILMNLIGNAIKHHDRKKGRIEVTVEDRGDCYAFAVKDDGPGIPAQFHEQIFKMFQTLRPRDQVEGSGMGLALVRKNLEVFGGLLQLESAVGQGSIFRFSWPKQQQLRRNPA